MRQYDPVGNFVERRREPSEQQRARRGAQQLRDDKPGHIAGTNSGERIRKGARSRDGRVRE
jgi:hypothetical protein